MSALYIAYLFKAIILFVLIDFIWAKRETLLRWWAIGMYRLMAATSPAILWIAPAAFALLLVGGIVGHCI